MKFLKNNKVAVIDERGQYSYAELLNHVDRIAKTLDCKKGSKIAICSENNVNFLATIIAVWKKKGMAFLIDPQIKGAKLNEIVAECQPDKVVVSTEAGSKFNNTLQKIVSEDSIILGNWEVDKEIEKNSNLKGLKDNIELEIEESETTSIVVYTSGTTGNMIGVELSISNILFSVNSFISNGLMREDDTLMSILPLYHAYGLATAMSAIYCGATLVMPKIQSSAKILEMIRETRPTTIASVPLFYRKIHKSILNNIGIAGRTMLRISRIFRVKSMAKIVFKRVLNALGGRIRYLSSGGANLPKKIVKDFNRMGVEIISGYGLSEAGPIISCSLNSPVGSVGRPVTEVRIVNREIWVKGPGVMRGYFKRPDETKERLEEGFLKTGDLGYLKDGFLYIDGRKSDLISLENGKNVWPYEIEKEINRSAAVKECVVFDKNEKIYLAAVLNKGKGEEDIKSYIGWYNKRAEIHKRVDDFFILDRIEKTNLGKVRRELLREAIA